MADLADLGHGFAEVVAGMRALVEGERAVRVKAVNIVKAELSDVKAEAEKAKAELSDVKAEAEKAKAEAKTAKAEAERAKAEADKTKAEAETAKAKAEKAQADAKKAWVEVDEQNKLLLESNNALSADRSRAFAETGELNLQLAQAECMIERMISDVNIGRDLIGELKKAMDGAEVMREEDAVKAVDADDTQLPGSPQRVQSPVPPSPESVQSPVLLYRPAGGTGKQGNAEMETGVARGAPDGASQTESEDEGLSAPSSPLREGSHNIQVARPQGGPAPEVPIVISDDDSHPWLAPETPTGTPPGTPVVPAAGLAPETSARTPVVPPVVPAAGQKRGEEGGASDKQEHKKRRLDEGGASAKQENPKPRFDYPTKPMNRLFKAFEEDYSNPQKWKEFQDLFLKTFRALDVAWGALQIQKGWDEKTTDAIFLFANRRMTRFRNHDAKMQELGYMYSGSGEDKFMRMTENGDSEGSVVVYLMHECARFIHDERDFKEK